MWKIALAWVCLGASNGSPVEPGQTPESLLQRYDAVMAPDNFDAVATMGVQREDGSVRTYKMRILKGGHDRLRLWFSDPVGIKGQEMLRQGDNLWVYMPNLKRALRVAARDAFQGGDFNNADVLRAAYQPDYTPSLGGENEVSNSWLVELTSRIPDAPYDRVKLWLHKDDGMPIKGEYYTQSGKMLRSAEFSEVRSFGGFKRPAKIVMRNMLATERTTTLTIETFDVKVRPGAGQFVLDSLGR